MNPTSIPSIFFALTLCWAVYSTASDSRYETRKKTDPPVFYEDQNPTGIDFPIGPVGGSVVRMNGRAERTWWQIFHNHEQRKGSMHLSAYADAVTATASWPDMASLPADFETDGKLAGAATAESPAAETTVDGALATNFQLDPGAERSLTSVLSWYLPGGTFGRADIPQWYFVDGGNQYENWSWSRRAWKW